MAEIMRSIMVTRVKDTIFIPLPKELWREIEGGCACEYCSSDSRKCGSPAYWDTLALAKDEPKRHGPDYTWTVHYPKLHGAKPKARAI